MSSGVQACLHFVLDRTILYVSIRQLPPIDLWLVPRLQVRLLQIPSNLREWKF